MADRIGTIYQETNVMLMGADGAEYPETQAIDGYHVNILPREMTTDLEPYVVNPTNQRRQFKGRDDTICLRFASKDQSDVFFPEEVLDVFDF